MRKRTQRNPDVHSDWLTQFDVDGPFLAYPVLKDMWPNGVDRLGDSDGCLLTFKQAFVQWQRAFDHYMEQPKSPDSKDAYDVVRLAWIDVVLDDIAEWNDLRTDVDVTVRSPGEQITVTATGALQGRDGEPTALVLVCDPTSGLREAGLDGWAANDIDRLAMLLRKARVELGIVTDGQWWALVWAKDGKPTGSGVVNALTWAEEPLLRDSFVTLINQRRFRAPGIEHRLSRLFERSELEAEEITEALGTQVRRSVELLVQAFSEARLNAAKVGDPDPLAEKPDDVYQAAVTVMMRIVFLLFAEERDMLPTEQLYWDSYAVKDLLDDLRAQATSGEESLDESFDAWHRLLAVSQALHGGVNYDEMRMPAYGGSLLDPDRFPWLQSIDQRGRLRLEVSDRVMLHVLESVQTVVAKGERRRISFREIDVEQIGYIYEGLLGYSCANVTDDIVLGLVGKDGEEPEIEAATLERLYDEADDNAKSFADALRAWVSEAQPAATSWSASKLTKLYEADIDEPEMRRLLTPVADGDDDLLDFLVQWSSYIRRDLRGIPLVIPVGGLAVVETPSRRNAGAHYTPRSLAEEVVLYALQPLVYEPGPLQTNDENEWRLKTSAAILDLKVADIAAGSGAFLVAAARYLSDRLVEAWIAEGMIDDVASADAENLRRRGLREVIARCLYGADINPMAVEMCKLSLWLVSMDKAKPFSFVDDKIFCGNSLLGLTTLDQLRYLHLDPKPATMQQQLLVDIDTKIDDATRLRHELASPVEERGPMRSSRAKVKLLEQFHQATAELRLIADGIVAAGLSLGGKPGRQLDDAFKILSWQLHEAFPADGSAGDPTKLLDRISSGLTPTVETDYERWEPLHWVIEAPDVMVEHDGFDAIVGNPPFLAGKKIAIANGSNMESWTKVDLGGMRGSADLCAHFIRRSWSLVRGRQGSVGLIANDRVGQGDTCAMSTQVLATEGSIYRAVSQFRWPGAASTSASVVWATHQKGSRLRPVLDGEPVAAISASLTDGDEADLSEAKALPAEFLAGRGVGMYGEGFVLEIGDPLIAKLSPRERALLRPFVNGQSLLSGRDSGQLAIDVNQFATEGELVAFAPQIAAHLKRTVKPIRDAITSQVHDPRYWGHWDKRTKLFEAVSRLPTFLGSAETTRLPIFIRIHDSSPLFEHVIIFATDSPTHFGVLSSAVHFAWFEETRTPRGATSSYTVSRVLRPFPFPREDADVASAAEAFDDVRLKALDKYVSVTKLYNAFDNRSETDPLVVSVRDAQVRLDEEVCRVYGWDDLTLEHGFFEFSAGEHFTVSRENRARIRSRLLAENLRRTGADGQYLPNQNSSDEQDTLVI
jgi:hypothetical protein